MNIISKTNFLSFLECPRDVWLNIHRPDLVGKLELSDFALHLLEQGNEVELEARKLFPKAALATQTGDEALEEAKQLMAAKTSAIFQPTFLVDGFIAKVDVLEYDKNGDCWNIYEIKGTNSLKENGGDSRDHIDDLAFQVSVLNRSGIKLGRYSIIHLNREYVRLGDIDLQALFQIDDVTEKVSARLPEIEGTMAVAREYLDRESEPPTGCECVRKGRSKHCTSFKISNPQVPGYSVHDLSRIHKTKLDLLVERGIFELGDIPDDFKLSDNQKNQVLAHRRQKPMINEDAIRAELDKLAYPLYFFDYEAFGPAIPAFNGYGPYKHIPFQFSLHILRSPDAPLEHVEFLHDGLSDPSEKVAEVLKENIKPGGTVIVWHKTFEQMVNTEIGTRLPQYAEFFKQLNGMIYDLEDIFREQHYVHHGFKGRSSIKKVLPTLAPELRYDVLGIKEGGQAADAWWRMVSPDTPATEKERIAKDLKIYCGLDTYAMYAIWYHLREVLGQTATGTRSPYAHLSDNIQIAI